MKRKRNYAYDFAHAKWPQLPLAIRFEFSPQLQALYARACRESGERFYFYVTPTDSLARPRTTQMLYGLPPATRAPALAIGWVLIALPWRIFRPVGETGTMPQKIEMMSMQRHTWSVIVDYGPGVERAMHVAFEQAMETLGRIRLRATAFGATA